MVDFIRGTLVQVRPDEVVVECGGIGFCLQMSLRAMTELPPIGREVKIYLHLFMRQDAKARDDVFVLYGFPDTGEREVFLLLVGVNGVGPKAAIAILSALSPDEVRSAIAAQDPNPFTRAQGIGKKTASRIIMELKEKVPAAEVILPAASSNHGKPVNDRLRLEVTAALVSLGFSAAQADRVLSEIPDQPGLGAEDLLRQALQRLAAF